MCLLNKCFENTVGKGEIALKEQFLLFPLFSTRLENFLPFSLNLKLLSANSFSLEESKICCSERVKRDKTASIFICWIRFIYFQRNGIIYEKVQEFSWISFPRPMKFPHYGFLYLFQCLYSPTILKNILCLFLQV